MAMINKTGVILQRELNLLLGFEEDDNTAWFNKDGVILQPELNLQSSSNSRLAAGAQLAEFIELPDRALSRLDSVLPRQRQSARRSTPR